MRWIVFVAKNGDGGCVEYDRETYRLLLHHPDILLLAPVEAEGQTAAFAKGMLTISEERWRKRLHYRRPIIRDDVHAEVTVVERDMILNALNENDWVQKAAAEALGMHPVNLHRKMRKHGLLANKTD